MLLRGAAGSPTACSPFNGTIVAREEVSQEEGGQQSSENVTSVARIVERVRLHAHDEHLTTCQQV